MLLSEEVYALHTGRHGSVFLSKRGVVVLCQVTNKLEAVLTLETILMYLLEAVLMLEDTYLNEEPNFN